MPEFDPKTQELIGVMLRLAGLLVLIALGIQVITVYRRHATARSDDAEVDLAESFREAFESGELSEEEYRRVREALDRGPAQAEAGPSPGATVPVTRREGSPIDPDPRPSEGSSESGPAEGHEPESEGRRPPH